MKTIWLASATCLSFATTTIGQHVAASAQASVGPQRVTREADDGPRIIGIRRAAARIRPATTNEMHVKFEPRRDGARVDVAVADLASMPARPLPRVEWPAKALRNVPNKHKARWSKRGDPAAYARALEQAARVPAYRDAGRVGPTAATRWTEIGSGIYHYDSRTRQYLHRAGRCSKAAYAHDFRQNMTTLFVGTMGGGLWRYDWGTGRWVSVSATLSGSPAVGAFLVDPNDPRHILIGTGDGWRYQGSGLYRSTNGGVTWQRRILSPTPDSFTQIRVDKSNRNVLMASSNKGIYRSDNRGWTWRRVYNGWTTDLVQDPRYHRYWYSAQRGVGILESSDGGLTFHRRGTGITGTIGRVSLTVCDSAPNYVYALVEGSGGSLNNVYRSSNYGFSWTPIDNQDLIGWGQGFHTCAIGVDPRDPDVLMVGMGGFQFTENATASSVRWVRRRQPGHADYTSFTFIPRSLAPSDTWVLITNDGGYYTYDYRANRFSADGNLRGINVGQAPFSTHGLAQSRRSNNLLLSGTQDNGVVRIDFSKSGSRTIEFAWGGDGGQVTWSQANTNHCAASVGGPPFGRYFSSNRFSSVGFINGPLPSHNTPTMLFHPFRGVSNLWTNDNAGNLYYTPVGSGPGSWIRANPNGRLWAGISAFDLAASSSTALYAAGNDGNVYTFSSGQSSGGNNDLRFARRTPPTAVRGAATVTADRFTSQPNTVYFATNGNRPSRVYRSTNRAVFWTNCTGNLASILPDANYAELIALPTRANVMFLATNVGVYRSDDTGRTWRRYMDGMPAVVDVRDIEIVYSWWQPILRISTNGRGWWQRYVD